jgi:hypothetical protein
LYAILPYNCAGPELNILQTEMYLAEEKKLPKLFLAVKFKLYYKRLKFPSKVSYFLAAWLM